MNTYDTAHMLHHLRQWQDAMQAAEQRLDALSELTGINPEAPLFESLYGLMGLATRQAADLTGASLEWLEPWWLEHAFGARPMQAGLHAGPRARLLVGHLAPVALHGIGQRLARVFTACAGKDGRLFGHGPGLSLGFGGARGRHAHADTPAGLRFFGARDGDDQFSRTRLAIVRAAAAIGRAMP